MIRFIRNLLRLLTIVRTLGRHGALATDEIRDVAPGIAWVLRLLNNRNATGRPGQRLAHALQELGPSFIKLGQALSTRADLVGDEIAADLAELRDRLPPFPGTKARAIIESELERPIGQLFTAFDDHAVAAASIAQVHFAETPDGRQVAVKVLRPNIEVAFRRDIDLMYWLADLALRIQPRLKRLKPREVVDTFADTVSLEMDLRMEASAASELAENFRDDPTFNVPAIDWDRTNRRVLTLSRVQGVQVDRVADIRAAGIDPDAVLQKAADSFFNQVFRDGFFHADLHPGNMFVDANGDLVAVDFGIMGRLDRQTRMYLADMLIGFLNRDYRLVAKVHFDAGFVPANQDMNRFMQACRAIGEPVHNKPLHEISVGRLLAQLFAVTEQFEMETQPQLLLLQKSMLTAEGVGRALNPEINMWELARPLIEQWMIENRGPDARLAETTAALTKVMVRLPDLLADAERTVGMVANGGLPIHPASIDEVVKRQQVRTEAQLRPIWAVILLLAAAMVVLAVR
ncbi:2-polyprenylphenol 6-hydroxylase [Indioceanicola profundi]|uniref:2-polyprenylphenol 6-hydroxylase n=1 Tax=Indioceanicola profundi TaxID=2220096 RepID=UPI000E6AD399|nr:2-polyprenylphenol 6-hydroxylase [Indioceanicola profundi]